MTVYRPADRRRLLTDVRQGRLRAVLVYGNDTGGVAEQVQAVIEAMRQSNGGEAPEVITLDEDQLREDPGRLADEAQALSMFGGKRVIRIRDAGERTADAVAALLHMPAGESLIIAQAGALRPASRLRKLFEKETALAAVPVYEDSARDIQTVIRETLEKEGLGIEPDALAALTEQLGADRAATRNELEKLALYCHGQQRVTLEDVRAICGDVSAHAMGDMLDAFFAGDYARGVRLLAALLAEGVQPAGVLAAASQHVQRLKPLALAVAAGESPEALVKSKAFGIFFRRQPIVARQLSAWTPELLDRAAESLLKATAESRRHPELAPQIAERCLLAFSVQARRRLGQRAA